MSRAPGARIGLELVGPSGEIFELNGFLGQGSFGEVYRAIGRVSGLTVAIKLLPIGGLTDDKRMALLNEMRLATQVVHPNVVQVLHTDEGTSPDIGPYLMMEYVDGGTLESILENLRTSASEISLDEARRLMIDIASGARAVNERLVHRDIKPDNVLYDGTRLKISDFGISKLIDERTRTHTFKGIGAVRYMAPEGWDSDKNTVKMDVYSAGLVFQEILTLRNPLEQHVSDTSDWRAWERAHRYVDCADIRSVRREVDIALAQLLARMIAKRPVERPGWEEILTVLENQAPSGATSRSVSTAVEAALKVVQEKQREELALAEAREKWIRRLETYQYSIMKLVSIFDEIVDAFNSTFQHGKITKEQLSETYVRYKLPIGGEIILQFFELPECSIALRGKQLVGGGYIRIDNGFSANLMLVAAPDDEYGIWEACLFNFNPIMDVAAVIRELRLSPSMKVPFGFEDSNRFYEQAGLTLTAMHVLVAEVKNDIKQFLGDVLETAFSRRGR
jgi:serine/threonine protein kinase